ncbi:caspase-1-like [Macrosteles quadrilineatus]|uniref:caspase-1-like n=1 Tax=Macrosteles quadrilineatus TaxID=74068 RepID=UPI0023E2A6E6|nr:caspase-1-like [Macrosteles quadrilineatus]
MMSDEFVRNKISARKPQAPSRSKEVNNKYYNMDNPRRGVAAIFNHASFDNSLINHRLGSDKDIESLRRTFGNLGFNLQFFIDLTFSEITLALSSISQMDHSKCDCFLLVFMSHGLEGKVRAKDVVFDVNHLWSYFTPERAPSLANKPKIFVIQACQGHGRMSGVKVADEGSEITTLIPSYVLPSSPDFLLALSTIPGYVSWRSPTAGSWYIQTLCAYLDRKGTEQDLLTLLTHVGRRVAIDYSAIDIRDNGVGGVVKKQIPSIISFLVKKVQFTRKAPKNICGNKRRIDHEDRSDDSDTALEGKKIKLDNDSEKNADTLNKN